ncbi:MAG: DegT/DnrJ/EryC1/StrS family aminotransferase, partial [Armatimonadetes bacterium]|nr:DegT/DnrJ/EryC1/StrS family aminotransferase [Armatimonadota bacterium]
DCAHAIYATHDGTYAGCNGDVGVFSFQMSKQMALGDAGMVVCRTAELREAMNEMVTFGTMPKRVGWNYRINEVVAAIGRVQLRRARGYVEDCIAAAQLYNQAVAGCDWIVPQAVPAGRRHAYHIWAARFEGERAGISREAFNAALGQAGVHLTAGAYLDGKPPYLHRTIAEPLGYGKGCPVRCPHRTHEQHYAPGLCPAAEDLMARLMIGGTSGGMEAHEAAAERLRHVIAQFDRTGRT